MTEHSKSSKAATIDIERSWENISISNDFLFGKLMRLRGFVKSCFREYFRIWRLTILKYWKPRKILTRMWMLDRSDWMYISQTIRSGYIPLLIV